jgi:large subunit ribosomal protein L15
VKLQELPRTTRNRKRVGRGTASGTGKTAGRGTKGQKSRTGHHMLPARFEGGQMPLTQRIPKLRGFRNPAQKTTAISISQLAKTGLTGPVDLAKLQEEKVVTRSARRLKVYGSGSAPKVSLKADAVTKSAEAAIKKAGGSVTVPKPAASETKKDAKQEPDAG